MVSVNKYYAHIPTWVNRHAYWTTSLGLARSMLALGTLLTLSCNTNATLFSTGIQNEWPVRCNVTNCFSVFCIVGNLYYAKAIVIIILCLSLLGIYPRITCVFHWWVTYSFASSTYIVDGGDQIAAILTFLSIPICIWDKRKWHWQSSAYQQGFYAKTLAFFSYLLISLQVSVIYFHAFVGKLKVREWVNGTALYYWFTHNLFGMDRYLYPILSPILKSAVLLSFSTWSVLILELFLASCLLISDKPIKRLAWAAGIIFHLLIVFIHGLASFFCTMCAALTLYLIAKDDNYVRQGNH